MIVCIRFALVTHNLTLNKKASAITVMLVINFEFPSCGSYKIWGPSVCEIFFAISEKYLSDQ
jgi:hypothetical protein